MYPLFVISSTLGRQTHIKAGPLLTRTIIHDIYTHTGLYLSTKHVVGPVNPWNFPDLI